MDTMDQNWITKMNKLYYECENKKEIALTAYTLYMIRILNGFEQMKLSLFYEYEKKVLERGIDIFCNHYEEQVNSVFAIPKEEVVKKSEYIKDIEDAVSELANVFKNVVDSTANTDRQMFTSMSVDSNLYDLSPKWFAYYSALLDKIVEIFDQEKKYAFLFHPTIKNNIQIVSLFKKRNKAGKVLLIYLPESRIADVKKIPVYLLHEAYHVMTKLERNRKKRAAYLNFNIVWGIQRRLFRDVKFIDENQKRNNEIESSLMDKWFNHQPYVEELLKIDEDGTGRGFYSDNIKIFLKKELKDLLLKLNETLYKDIKEVYVSEKELDPVAAYSKVYSVENGIRKNLMAILYENVLEEMLDKYLRMYREIYADLSCILTLDIDPDVYETVIIETIPFKIEDGEYQDIDREIRMEVVAEILTECGSLISNTTKWKEYVEKKKENCTINQTDVELSEEFKRGIEYSMEDVDVFKKYLKVCAEQLIKTMSGEKKEKIQKIRDVVKKANLQMVFSGELEERIVEI